MNGLMVGMAMLAATTSAPQVMEQPRLRIVPVSAMLSRIAPAAPAPAPQLTRPRSSRTDRIIGVAGGLALGWLAGGYIGGYTAAAFSSRDDDVSLLRGVMIGAPLGAIAGAVIGYRATR